MRDDDDLDPLPAVEIEEPAPCTLLVRIRGDLDADATARLRTELDRELAETAEMPVRVVLVDLSRVTLCGSAALNLLLELRRRFRLENRHLVLVGTARPAVHRPMRLAGLLPLFDTRITVQAALRRPDVQPCRPALRSP
jgi:anti-anti-sigma factor